MISNRRRRGQGMTEYIVLVGLIGILLIAAVTRFKNQIQYTIEGTAGTLDEKRIGHSDPNLDGDDDGTPRGPGDDDDSPRGPLRETGRTTPSGEKIWTDGTSEFLKRGSGSVPYTGR
jgi:Flp pilus assembly pilin Flp